MVILLFWIIFIIKILTLIAIIVKSSKYSTMLSFLISWTKKDTLLSSTSTDKLVPRVLIMGLHKKFHSSIRLIVHDMIDLIFLCVTPVLGSNLPGVVLISLIWGKCEVTLIVEESNSSNDVIIYSQNILLLVRMKLQIHNIMWIYLWDFSWMHCRK